MISRVVTNTIQNIKNKVNLVRVLKNIFIDVINLKTVFGLINKPPPLSTKQCLLFFYI
jgi:hypothetical protein